MSVELFIASAITCERGWDTLRCVILEFTDGLLAMKIIELLDLQDTDKLSVSNQRVKTSIPDQRVDFLKYLNAHLIRG